MGTMLLVAAAFAAGYIAYPFTWPKVMVWLNGAAYEALKLKERARALEAKILDGGR